MSMLKLALVASFALVAAASANAQTYVSAKKSYAPSIEQAAPFSREAQEKIMP